MNWIVTKIKWIMLASGALTCTMIFAAIAPQAALSFMFGANLEGPLAEIVVRNWGALIALIGAMLIYGAYHAPVRPLVLTVAAISKLTFIGLILTQGTQNLIYQAGVSIAADFVMAVLFILCLMAARRNSTANSPSI